MFQFFLSLGELLHNDDQGDDNSEGKIEFLTDLAEEPEEKDDGEDQEITSPRKTRSGRSYIQNGVKMRPSIREGKSRPRYDQPYLQKKKSKDN